MSASAKYLERFAEPEARLPELDGLRAHGPWTHAITIPVRRERSDCLRAVAQPSAHARVLVVLVVNAADDPDDRCSNAALLAELEARAKPCWRGPGLSLHRLPGPGLELDVLAVDRSTPPRNFSAREGVGLARKLGGDLITRLIFDEQIESAWIHTTDADVELPAEHFDRVAELSGAAQPAAAAVAPFRHVPAGVEAGDAATHQATLRYELSLRYYVLGLRSAGSLYGFHTIGSLLSVAAAHYVHVRGFPRRLAGEDFYMLNKLAKLGLVHCLAGAPVRIRSRRSTRAPFGTGPAVEALLAGKPHEVYDPRTFAALGRALRALTVEQRLPSELVDELPELASWRAGAAKLAQRYRTEQLSMRLHEHFDGFRTLKLIHALSDRWPKLPWSRALAQAHFLQHAAERPLDWQCDHLAELESECAHNHAIARFGFEIADSGCTAGRLG